MELEKEIIAQIKQDKIILLGEVHGTREIPELLVNLLTKVGEQCRFTFMIEVPMENQPFFDLFFAAGFQHHLDESPFFSRNMIDGRNSNEFRNLLKSLYNRNITVLCIDVNPQEKCQQQQREQHLAKKIAKVSGGVIALVGNFHASLSKYKDIEPMGMILHKRKKIFSVLLSPSSGSFYNLGLKSCSILTNKRKKYSLSINIGEVTPATK